MEKKMIWSSEMLYDDEARENYLENMRAITENKDYQLTDEEWADEVYLDLSDERGNLDKKVNGIIIAFADLGLWQGRRNAFQFFGNNIANILHTRCEDAEWYGDAYNIRGILHHHDGTNYVLPMHTKQMSKFPTPRFLSTSSLVQSPIFAVVAIGSKSSTFASTLSTTITSFPRRIIFLHR